jgi:hypothetical protein
MRKYVYYDEGLVPLNVKHLIRSKPTLYLIKENVLLLMEEFCLVANSHRDHPKYQRH